TFLAGACLELEARGGSSSIEIFWLARATLPALDGFTELTIEAVGWVGAALAVRHATHRDQSAAQVLVGLNVEPRRAGLAGLTSARLRRRAASARLTAPRGHEQGCPHGAHHPPSRPALSHQANMAPVGNSSEHWLKLLPHGAISHGTNEP